VQIVKVTSTIATKEDPSQYATQFVGRAVGDERSTLINHLVSDDGKRQK
jgi:hypothetical protein